LVARWHCFWLFFFRHGSNSIKGIRFLNQGELGHHLIWKPPAAVGERSWIVHASPSECQVRIKLETLLRQCGSVVVMTTVMFLAFRFPAGNERLVASLTNRKVALVSLVLALCLPLPQTEGVPLVALVVMAPISLFRDNGHVGPWALPLIAGTALAVCFTVMFLLTSAVAWLVRRGTPPSSSSG
jgi:hypothetical protein